jgi:hypothetical protein
MRNDDKFEHFTKGFEKTDIWKDTKRGPLYVCRLQQSMGAEMA